MQKMSFLTFFFGLFTTLFGQNELLFTDGQSSYGEFNKISALDITQKIIATKNNIFQICRRTAFFSDRVTIYVYDAQTLNMTKEIPLNLTYLGKESSFQNIVVLNNIVYIFSSQYTKATKTKCFLVQTFNQKTFQLNNDLRKISEITNLESSSTYFVESPDKTKQLIYTEIKRKTAEKEAFLAAVLDSNMQPLWTREVELPYEGKLFSLEEYHVDNVGNVYFIEILFNNKVKDKVKNKPNYNYKVFKFSAKELTPIEFDITLTDKFVNQLKIHIKNDTIVCAGIYRNQNTYATAGIFYAAFDPNTKSCIKESYQRFEAADLYEGASERKIKKAQKQIDKQEDITDNMQLRDIVLRENGNFLLILEDEDVHSHIGFSSNGAMRTTTYNIYGDIFVVNISSTGSIGWVKRIIKTQMSVNDGGYYSSYALALNKNKIYLAFNDNIENELV